MAFAIMQKSVLRRSPALAAGSARRSSSLGNNRVSVIRRFTENDNQAQKEVQGSKAPKNPITGQPLEEATGKDKYTSQVFPASAADNTRIVNQLGAQSGGRDFAEVQAFDGLGPEVINSRLAMLGFAVALALELTTGKDVFQQVAAYPLATIATFVIVTAASWIPFQKGQSYNVKSGPFTPAREVGIGRVAMVGFWGLVMFELWARHPFFAQIFGFYSGQ